MGAVCSLIKYVLLLHVCWKMESCKSKGCSFIRLCYKWNKQAWGVIKGLLGMLCSEWVFGLVFKPWLIRHLPRLSTWVPPRLLTPACCSGTAFRAAVELSSSWVLALHGRPWLTFCPQLCRPAFLPILWAFGGDEWTDELVSHLDFAIELHCFKEVFIWKEGWEDRSSVCFFTHQMAIFFGSKKTKRCQLKNLCPVDAMTPSLPGVTWVFLCVLMLRSTCWVGIWHRLGRLHTYMTAIWLGMQYAFPSAS